MKEVRKKKGNTNRRRSMDEKLNLMVPDKIFDKTYNQVFNGQSFPVANDPKTCLASVKFSPIYEHTVLYFQSARGVILWN